MNAKRTAWTAIAAFALCLGSAGCVVHEPGYGYYGDGYGYGYGGGYAHGYYHQPRVVVHETQYRYHDDDRYRDHDHSYDRTHSYDRDRRSGDEHRTECRDRYGNRTRC